MKLDDTIAAVSTPTGTGGIAVLRISGEDTGEILQKVFRPMKGQLSGYPYRYAIYGDIVDENGNRIDTGLAVRYEKGKSFTGDEMAEISCHGGVVVTSLVLKRIVSAGARYATAGEFSRRAFINGKMSLSEAEATAELLEAKSEAAVYLLSAQRDGILANGIRGVADRLIALTATLYAYIDYPDEDLRDLDDDSLIQAVEKEIDSIKDMLNTYRAGRAVTAGVPTVIAGTPNSGKSSLFNCLIGEEKAIVTKIPGTTRDLLEFPVKVGRVLLNLTDTAGLRHSEDVVEKIGIERAEDKIFSHETQLILALFDGSRPCTQEDCEWIDRLSKVEATVIPVLTKSDLLQTFDAELLTRSFGFVLQLSVKTGEGVEKLKEKIESLYLSSDICLSDGGLLFSARQRGCLEQAKVLLEEMIVTVTSGQNELAGMILERAIAFLLETDGRQVSEEIVHNIFSRFCVGK